MTDERIAATFKSLLEASVSQKPGGLRTKIDPATFRSTPAGAVFNIPLAQFAVVGVDNVGGRDALPEPVDWLIGDAEDSPILSRIRLVPTDRTRGKLASGSLPSTTMQAERTTAAAYSDPTLSDNEFDLSKVIESKSEVSLQSILQAGSHEVDQLVLESHVLAIQDALIEGILYGDGTGNNLQGVAGLTGVGAATYVAASIGKDTAFTTAEASVEDAKGRLAGMAWAFGPSLSNATRTVAIDPGSSRRVEEGGRLTLSGVPVQRVGGLTATTGILADWGRVIVPVASEVEVTVDGISQPGELRLTSRLPVANPIVNTKALVYVLEQAP